MLVKSIILYETTHSIMDYNASCMVTINHKTFDLDSEICCLTFCRFSIIKTARVFPVNFNTLYTYIYVAVSGLT